MPHISSLGTFHVRCNGFRFVETKNGIMALCTGTAKNGDTATGKFFFSDTMVNSAGPGSDKITVAQKSVNMLARMGMDMAKFKAGQVQEAIAACNDAEAEFVMKQDEDQDGNPKEGVYEVAFINPAARAAPDSVVVGVFAKLRLTIPTGTPAAPPAPKAAPAFPGASEESADDIAF